MKPMTSPLSIEAPLTLEGVLAQLQDGEEFRIRKDFDGGMQLELTDPTVPYAERKHVARLVSRVQLETVRVPYYMLLHIMDGLLRTYRGREPRLGP